MAGGTDHGHCPYREDVISVEIEVSPQTQLKVPANLREGLRRLGRPRVGPGGQQVADTVLARCETDYAKVSGYFGGISTGPFSVILF